LTLAEFRQWMAQTVCRHYHARLHRSLGMAPLIAWERGLTNDVGAFVPPPLLSRPLDFRMDFLPFEFRKLRRTGIEFGASRYWHEDLAPMLNRTEDVRLRYDPRSPGQIWVKRDDGVLVTAPAIAGRAVGQMGSCLALDAEKLAELDRRIDDGFEATDRIEAAAAAATSGARRSGATRTAPATNTAPAVGMNTAVPAMRPTTGIPTVEEWL
jgi:putative transposase